MRKIMVVLAWVILLPIMLAWEIFKGLLGLAGCTGRRKRGRGGVMCGPGGVSPRGKKFRMTN